MNVLFLKKSLAAPLLAVLAVAWLGAAACFPATPTATPAAPQVQTTQAREAPPSLQPAPTAASVPPRVVAPAPATEAPAADLTTAAGPAVAESQPDSPTSTPAPVSAARDETPETVPADSPVADSAAFYDLALLEERAFSYLSELAEDVGVRTSGSGLEREASDYLVRRLQDLGYSPEVQDFSWDSPTATISITAPDPGTLDANTLRGTASGQATAPLVFVGLGRAGDMPPGGLEGKIALMERGEITFGSKVDQVHGAGALGAVIFNNMAGSFNGTLGGSSQIPAISLSRADGRGLRDLLEQGETVEAAISVHDNAVPSRNLIAELPGAGEGVVVLGAHYDTVPDSIGASDNSSGMGVLLAVAEQLADRTFPYTLRFIAFGSEETGLHGSEHYVENLSPEELEEIYLMINLDSVGSGNQLRLSGDRWVTNHLVETATREGLSLNSTSGSARGGSDHIPFREAWVPIVYFQANDLSRINSPADTMEYVNPALLGDATALVLDLLENVHTLSGYGE